MLRTTKLVLLDGAFLYDQCFPFANQIWPLVGWTVLNARVRAEESVSK